MKEFRMILNVWILVLLMGCSSGVEDAPGSDIKDDEGEETLLTGKTAEYIKGEFQTDEDGSYKKRTPFSFDVYDPYFSDEFYYAEDLNGDGKLEGTAIGLVKKYPEVKARVESITAYTEYELPFNVKGNNLSNTFSFGKGKCVLTTRYCELAFKKGDKLKVEKYDVQFKKEDFYGSTSDGNEFEIMKGGVRFCLNDKNKIEGYDRLSNYKMTADYEDRYYDFRDVEKKWVEEKTEFSYRMNGYSVIIENKDYTYSGTFDHERRKLELRQTYPGRTSAIIYNVKY